MEDNPTSRAFRRRYVIAGCIAILLALPSFRSPDVMTSAQLASLIMWIVPLVRRGGFFNNLRLALASVSLNLVTSGRLVWSVFDYLYQHPSLEGPHGEGSPLAEMLAAFNISLLWLVPWGLALGSGWVACFTAITGHRTQSITMDSTPSPEHLEPTHEN